MAMTNTISLGHGSNGLFDDADLQLLVRDQRKNLLDEQEVFHRSLEKKIDQQTLRIALSRTDKDTLHAAVVQFYKDIHHQVSAKEQSDCHGIGKLNSKFSAFAKWTIDFFETYSGISEIVRGIDNNFGPIAYGTFSIFFMMAQSKEMYCQLTHRILEELGKWLPRLEIINAIDSKNPKSMKFVFEIYVEMVSFFRCTSEFLCSSKASRFWKLISQPTQQGLQECLDRIKEKCKDLLEESIFRILELKVEEGCKLSRLENSMNENAELTKKNAAVDHHNRIQEVAKALDLPPDFDTYFASVIINRDSAFDEDLFKFQKKAAFRPVRLQQISLKALSQRNPYQAWTSATQSSLLLLGGENGNISIPQSWLSPVATEFFHFVQRSPKCRVFIHSINAARAYGHYREPEHEILMTLKSILYQVLREEPRLCQSCYKKVISAYWFPSTGSITDDQIEAQIRHCVDILSAVLSSSYLETKTVFIVVDGVERLAAPAPQMLFESVLELLDECNEPATIKVLATCSTLVLDNIKNSEDEKGLRYALGQGGNKQIMDRVFADLFWNQPILEGGN